MTREGKARWKPGILKTHEYTSFLVAPAQEKVNEGLDTLIKSFYAVRNAQMFKSVRDGQPVIGQELYADHKQSYYLYTVPSSHKALFAEKLHTNLPGAGIKEHEIKGWPFTNDDSTLIAYLTLTKDSYFPLKMDASMICKDVLSVTDTLIDGEKIFVQVLLEPLDDGWQEELERSYELYLSGQQTEGSWLRAGGKKLDKKITALSQSLSEEKPEKERFRKHREIKEFTHKIRQYAFHTVIRLSIKASSYDRRNELIEAIAAAYKSAGYHNQWQLSPVIRKRKAIEMMRDRKMPLLSAHNLLCEDEVKVLLRLPTIDIVTKTLERMKPDEKGIDKRITTRIIPIGRSIAYDSPGETIGFSIADDDTASKGRIWIAPPGSGKTTAAVKFMRGGMEVGHGGSMFDVADGNLYRSAVEATEPKDRHRLVLVNFADTNYPHIFNFSSLGTDGDTIGAMFAEFFEVFYHTASNHRMNSLLRKAAMTVFTHPDATFLELILLMRDEDFRKKFLPTLRKKSPELFLWWKTEFPKLAKSDSQITEILQPILYRLDNLQYNKNLGPIFCGRGGRLRIAEWMNEGKWVLYNISNGVFLENEIRMMMSFLNYSYWTATLARETLLQAKLNPIIHHKIFDEPQTYMSATPITSLSISKSRKYRVTDNFFIQNPVQIIKKDEALWREIIGMNPHILVGGGLDTKGIALMSDVLGITEQELRQLESLEYHWYFKTYVGKTAVPAFIFDASGLNPDYGFDPALSYQWRQYFAPKLRAEVTEDINARNLKLTVQEYRDLLSSYDHDDDEEGVELG